MKVAMILKVIHLNIKSIYKLQLKEYFFRLKVNAMHQKDYFV